MVRLIGYGGINKQFYNVFQFQNGSINSAVPEDDIADG